MNLPALALLALLAAAESKRSTGGPRVLKRKDALPGNFRDECKWPWWGSTTNGVYGLHADCGTGSARAYVSLDPNKCFNNDNGKVAWGTEYD